MHADTLNPPRTEQPEAASTRPSPLAPSDGINTLPRLDHGMLNIPGRLKGIDQELDRYKSEQARAAKAEAKAAAAKRREAKAQAKAFFAEHGKAMAQRYATKYPANEVYKLLDRWVKWEPNKFLKIAQEYRAEIGG